LLESLHLIEINIHECWIVRECALLDGSQRIIRQIKITLADKKPKNAKSEKPKTLDSDKEVYYTSTDGTIMVMTDGSELDAELYEESN